MDNVLTIWQDAFLEVVQEPATAEPLKDASLGDNLSYWTRLSTAAVVESCRVIGWRAAGIGHRLDILPQPGQEYLGLDVMAFADTDNSATESVRWPLPIAVFELENHRKDDRVAYSLWKVLCIRAALRVVIAYRPDWERSRQLVSHLQDNVIGGLTPAERSSLAGETVVVIGNRGDGETFPWGYFKFWKLDSNLGRFDKS